MARIDVLPSIEIIRGFKGILDFYLWRGLPCVRAWPTWRPTRQTDASKAAALTFGAIIKAYSTMGEIALQAYRDDAAGQPRSARDIYVSSQYGNLHEADMSDFLGLLTDCRDFLSALTTILDALHSVDTDELVARIEHSVLPDGASTAAAQTTQLTALQKIDDLQDALESKGLDRLLTRGMDQLFSYKQNLAQTHWGNLSGDDGWIQTALVPAGQIHIVTNIISIETQRPTTRHYLYIQRNGTSTFFHDIKGTFPLYDLVPHAVYVPLDVGDRIRCEFIGGLAADSCRLDLTGYIMTLET